VASSRAIEAARAFVKIFVDDTPLKRGLATLTTRLAGAAKGVAGIAASLGTAAVAGGIGLIVSGMSAAAASVWRFSEAAAGLQDMADRTGASTESLSQLRYAAEQSGSSLEDVERGMRKLSDVTTEAGKGNKAAAAALEQIGISADSISGKSVEEQFLMVAEGLSKIEDPAKRASAAMDVFGKGSTVLLPMMEDGAAGIATLMAEADKLGMTISGEQAKAAAAFDDKWQGLVATLRNASNIIAVAVLPYLSQMIDMVMATWPAIQTLAKLVGETLVASFGQAYDAIGLLLQPFAGLGSAVSDTLSSIMGALTAGDVAAAAGVFWASLDVAWAQGIAAISDQWYAWRNGFLDVFGQAVSGVRKMWAETQAWLSSGIVDIMAYLDSSLDADAIKAEIDLMATQQVQQIDQQAAADQQARADAYAARLDRASADLAAAREQWSAAIATATNAAAAQPEAAAATGKKFDELIGELKSSDIATRVDRAVQQAGPAQDLRTSAGAGALTSIINQQGTLSQQQLDQLKEIRGIQRQLLKATQDGMIGWAV
jgi:hypothetical protein